MYEIDRQLEKEDSLSQDNIFPESKANTFFEFKEQNIFQNFHSINDWNEKYKIALSVKDPSANFILKRLIFDESPQTLSEDDFKKTHKELSERLLLNQERPFTTIPEAMTLVDTERSRIEDENNDDKEKNMQILDEYNKYLEFLENYFSDRNATPLKTGDELIKQIYN